MTAAQVEVRRCVRVLLAVGIWGPVSVGDLTVDTGISDRCLNYVIESLYDAGYIRRRKRSTESLRRQFFRDRFSGFYSKARSHYVWSATEKLEALL